MKIEHNLKIPFEQRYQFAEPLDNLIAGERSETIAKIRKILKNLIDNWKIYVYLVGDIVTKDFLADDFLKTLVQLCIVDEKTQRAKIDIVFGELFEDIIEFENPAGMIKKESWALIKKILDSKKRTVLRITEGEEDLLAIPLVLELPIIEGEKHFVFYGQPPITDSKLNIPQGIVMIDVNSKIQEIVKKILSLMERID